MSEENISQEFRLNYLIEEVNWNELMSKNHKKIFTTLNYIEHFLILASTITGCFFISAFATLIGITSSAIGLKIQKLQEQKT